MDGLGLAREVSASRPHVKIIVTSGATMVSDEDLPRDGTFLPKPYPTDRLVSIVARKLDG
jgi:DNA-binding NtrC family response regulator